jgi:hypothetical protein
LVEAEERVITGAAEMPVDTLRQYTAISGRKRVLIMVSE